MTLHAGLRPGERRAERRAHARSHVAWNAVVGYIDRPMMVEAAVRDISIGGVRVCGPITAAIGDEILLMMPTKLASFPAVARVVSSYSDNEGRTEVRMEFTCLPDASRARLQALAAGTETSVLTPGLSPPVLDLLRKAVTVVDQMWRDSTVARASDASVRLGEVSHSIHRALIILEDDPV